MTRATVEATYRSRTARSAKLHREAMNVFPGGVTRSVTWHPPYPTYVSEGCGCRVTDVDGNEYTDFLNNFGSMIHGHAHPEVVRALASQAARGTDFGMPTEQHLVLARTLKERVASAERIRFANSGTEALMYAIRAARAFTGRSKILKMEGSYHGGFDSVVVSVDPAKTGAPPAFPAGAAGSPGLFENAARDTLVAPFNDLATTAAIILEHRAELAAVLVEPVMVRGMIPATPEFLDGLRAVTTASGVLLLLDDVVTFRLAWGGAQELFGVQADLTTWGKIIGGGLPVGAFGGRADIMEKFNPTDPNPIHHSGTFAGNAATMAAGAAALQAFSREEISRVNGLGDRLREGLRWVVARGPRPAQITGIGSLVGVHFTEQAVRDYRSSCAGHRDLTLAVHLALLNRGVFARPAGGFFLSTPMTERDVDTAVDVFADALHDATAP